ncbi:MAG: ABC transporter ATP-binding protein [Chloroflexi bacterium]|nr:ABC transporter ATP-binding protein [Chloroflexota bacterium]
MLEINQIEKSYPKFHLGPVDLTLPEGYIMGLVGENGAGKSTLIYTIMNLLPPKSGEVSIFGMNYKENEVLIKEHIGFIYEQSSFYENLTPSSMARLLRLSYKNWDDATYRRLMEQFSIAEKPLKKLSKGQRATYHFIAALSHNARLLILDEPTSGLDPIVRRELLDELRRYVEPGNRSVLFSTHITSDLEQVADLITFIHKGQVLFSKDVEELRESYHVVKGAKDVIDTLPLLGKQSKRTHAQGLYEGERGDLADAQVELEPASLEDIMFFMKRGDEHEQIS